MTYTPESTNGHIPGVLAAATCMIGQIRGTDVSVLRSDESREPTKTTETAPQDVKFSPD